MGEGPVKQFPTEDGEGSREGRRGKRGAGEQDLAHLLGCIRLSHNRKGRTKEQVGSIRGLRIVYVLIKSFEQLVIAATILNESSK